MTDYQPSIKSPAIERALETMSGRTTAITSSMCINPPYGCGKPITPFKDNISEREYTISGLCQSCQDEVFKDYEPEPEHS